MSKQSKQVKAAEKFAALCKTAKVVTDSVQTAKTAAERKAARKQLTDFLSGK
jgi:membrane protein involved in colicin uptake